MKIIHKSLLLAILLVFGFTVAYFSSCKKIDLKRIAAIATEPVDNVSASTAMAKGTLVDLGSNQSDHGFCFSEEGVPTIDDNKNSMGIANNTGAINLVLFGLQPETNYNIRSYIIDDAGLTYGDTKSFKTLAYISEQWLHYDDGENIDGIGYTTGGSFDVAIRFPKEGIQDFAGGEVSRIRFFPREGAPAEYYVTIWEGNEPPELKLLEFVDNPNVGGWTEFILPESFPIDVSKDLWIGYWVENSLSDTYPAGVDNGPAMTGFGDLISNDDGESWTALSTIDPPNLDYNWNLQAFVQNTKGETVLLSKKSNEVVRNKQKVEMGTTGSEIQSKNNNKN